MKAPTYTDEQIIEAGMQLLADNKRVSPFAIRNAIGGGNPKRIKKIWEESQHKAVEGQMVREQADLPTEFEDALEATKQSLDELAKRMYNRAQEIAESRVRESITAARKAKEAAETEIAEAMDVVNHLDAEKEALSTALEEAKKALSESNAQNNRLQERIKTLTNKAEKDRHALQQAKQNYTELQQDNTTLTVKKELVKQQLKESRQALNQSNEALTTANQTIENIKLDRATIATTNDRLKTIVNDFETQASNDQATIEQLITENHQKETALAISSNQQEEGKQRIKVLATELQASRKAEENAKIEASELRGKIKILKSQTAE